MERSARFWRAVLLAAPLGVFAVLVVWPLLSSFCYSFTNWNGFNPNYDFVGFANFAKIATDRLFLNAAINTVIWMAAAILVPTLLGLGLALLIDSRIPGGTIFKSIFYLPICLSAVVVGQIWIWIYQADWGLLNTVISAVTGEKAGICVARQAGNRARLGDPCVVLAADRPDHGDLPCRPHVDFGGTCWRSAKSRAPPPGSASGLSSCRCSRRRRWSRSRSA